MNSKLKVPVNIPIILEFSDYHEIDYVGRYMGELFNRELQSEELSFRDGSYWAIFYFKKDKEYRVLVKEHEELCREYEEEEEDES